MKRCVVLLSVLAIAPLAGYASQQVIPAGSLIQCTISEPKISSKTTAVGDPVLCHVSHADRFGSSMLPYYSYMVGRFEEYKDPGHFVGKGWMELKFDHMVIEPNTIVPIEAKVVDVKGYNVDRDGRILGKGHAVRDAIEWSIPILWPIDLLMLPMRGPRPTLKAETPLTLKIMDDMVIPVADQPEPQPDSHGLIHRTPTAEATPPVQDNTNPEVAYDPPVNDAPPAQMAYAPPPPPVVAYYQPYPPMVVGGPGIALGYRSGPYGMAARSSAYYSRQMVAPPRMMAYNSGPYGYNRYRPAAPPRAYASGGGSRGYSSGGGARGGFRR
jgi:hypothetical protein